jgi:hypothetical protein
MIEIAPLQLLAIFAAEAPAIPPDIGQRIADGIHVWDRITQGNRTQGSGRCVHTVRTPSIVRDVD